MDEIHEAGIRRALRAWLSVQTERPTEEDRLTMLEQMRARAFAIFGAADERAEAADRQAAAMEAKWRRGEWPT
jgi:hypothetical protein